MSPRPVGESLIDRAEISDVVHRYARAIDLLDWELFRSCFTERVDIDFSSMGAGVQTGVRTEDWMEQVRAGMSGFDATHHLSANHSHWIEGDRATCESYLAAEHFIFHDDPEGRDESLTLGGYYANELIRTPEGWKICASTLTVTWHRGNFALFEQSRQRFLRGEVSPKVRDDGAWARARGHAPS
jgi:hypothetical protein